MLYMVTFTINIPQMLAYIPYMDSMGMYIYIYVCVCWMCIRMYAPYAGHVCNILQLSRPGQG